MDEIYDIDQLVGPFEERAVGHAASSTGSRQRSGQVGGSVKPARKPKATGEDCHRVLGESMHFPHVSGVARIDSW
jgi:hypothetical protein